MGLLFIRGLSTGGTDLLSLLLANRMHEVPVGTILMYVDGAVVIMAVLIFRDIDVALYSAITIFVTSKVVDSLVQGADYAKVIYVITEKGQELGALLLAATGRGVTMSPAVGSYSGQEKRCSQRWCAEAASPLRFASSKSTTRRFRLCGEFHRGSR